MTLGNKNARAHTHTHVRAHTHVVPNIPILASLVAWLLWQLLYRGLSPEFHLLYCFFFVLQTDRQAGSTAFFLNDHWPCGSRGGAHERRSAAPSRPVGGGTDSARAPVMTSLCVRSSAERSLLWGAREHYGNGGDPPAQHGSAS